MLIRPARSDDFPAIGRLAAHFAAHFEEPAPTLDPQAVDRFFSGASPLMHTALAEIAGEVVGFMSWVLLYDIHNGRARIFLNDLCVLKNHRGHQVGTALMNHLTAWAQAHRPCKIVWEVWDQNHSAIAFYKSLGARPVEQVTMFHDEIGE